MTQMDTIQIVTYEPRFAASIAEMWNASHESWGGDNTVQTEEMILKEHHNHTHIDVFLAVKDDEVVGYCSFSHYKEDTGALYIPLLNVRPDYHGYKIGKRLVLRAVEETLQRGWPRLDLYTWPGNIKAVPTYKKAGFFWERRDDTTHLINLIPAVLQTPAVQSYFEQIDWYTDSTREIVTEPDGRQEYGFDYFTYQWIKDDLQLKMEYERTGRGLRLIETNDYLIQATIPVAHQLPFGTDYPIVYEVINKTGKPLSLQIKSIANDDIAFELQESRIVESQATIEGHFQIKPIEEEQDPFQTHPVVEAELIINGQSAIFKSGVEPKFPVRLKVKAPHRSLIVGEEVALELTVENEYDQQITYYLQCPNDNILSFQDTRVAIEVPARSRRCVTLTTTLLQYGIWHHAIPIYTQPECTEESRILEQHISLVFPGIQSAFGGETAKDWVIANGKYSVYLNKINNNFTIYEGTEEAARLFYPKFGLPYKNEFQKNRASQVTFRHEDAMIMEARYDVDHMGVVLTTIVTLYANGVISRYYTIENQHEQERSEPLFLKEHFRFPLENSIIPYRNQYIDTAKSSDASAIDYWQASDITENWLFSYTSDSTYGVIWSKDIRLTTDHWLYGLEHPLSLSNAGDKVETPALLFAIGTWNDWQDFRKFAVQNSSDHNLTTTAAPLECKLNQGNPFVQQSVDVQIIEHKNAILDGTLSISSQLGSVEQTQYELSKTLESHDFQVQLPLQTSSTIDVLTLQLDMDSYVLEEKRLVFPVSEQAIIQEVISTEHGDIHTVRNGVLEFQASQSFAPTLFSLKSDGLEWLDSSFPQPVARSWWNPWIGGISLEVHGLSQRTLLEEKRSVEFTEIKDNLGNTWSGICITIDIENNVKLKGLSIQQYYVTLPGVPVLCHFIKLDQQTGTTLAPFGANHFSFYKVSEEITDAKAYVTNTAKENITYKAGRVQYETEVKDKVIRFGSHERKSQLIVVDHPDNETCAVFVNTHLIASVVIQKIFANHQQQVWGKPQFYMISDMDIPDSTLTDLFNIQFDFNTVTED
ncbi:GNAT family N-acetyltransferase [Paenibacillus kyungheensis]|uniref:GNAT family N-acetyltransferase n=1 Tax=Paenibacillus kyungheensis TaxID=1452732 RepID=A0AAX3LVU0_9BACL|nr:GNAT family N-acetyltransferase [Paenibacillus kyungheensis]WCT53952.1 GNAT family N-acetyltransferase [Paenibacillus kyungheensis]